MAKRDVPSEESARRSASQQVAQRVSLAKLTPEQRRQRALHRSQIAKDRARDPVTREKMRASALARWARASEEEKRARIELLARVQREATTKAVADRKFRARLRSMRLPPELRDEKDIETYRALLRKNLTRVEALEVIIVSRYKVRPHGNTKPRKRAQGRAHEGAPT